MNLEQTFADHIAKLRKAVEGYLEELTYENLIIDAGVLSYFFADDQSLPFRPTPHFNHWCPLNSPGHILQIHPSMQPRLFYFQPEDFWYEAKALGSPYWSSAFEISTVGDLADTWKKISGLKRAAYIGPQEQKAKEAGLAVNPPDLIARLDWLRSFKSEYEVFCLQMAQERAAHGHQAARNLFVEGASELEIFHAYLKATQSTENELPYSPIIALNEKGAFLHYQDKRRDRQHDVLLIDAGAKFEAYGSDITRTYSQKDVAEPFQKLLAGMEKSQLELCAAVKPGVAWPEFHELSQIKMYELLMDCELLRGIDQDAAIDHGVVRAFFPHGIGHLLGVQTHDVGGQQINAAGDQKPPPARYPKLRTTRDLEPGLVLTVEPGIYFIEMLLEPFRTHALKDKFNWPLIEKLMPLGGMRIEDNVLVTEDGHRNLTRQYLP